MTESTIENQWRMAGDYTGEAFADFAYTGVSVERYIQSLDPQERIAFLAFVESAGRFICDVLEQDDKIVDDFLSYYIGGNDV